MGAGQTTAAKSEESTSLAPSQGSRSGLVSGFTAYALWGVFPIYFKALSDVSPWRSLCHRVVWSVLFLALVVSVRREWSEFRRAVGSVRTVGWLALAALLIAANWLVFIYAVTTGRALEASLGYFINPLVSVALGLVFYCERLRAAQWLEVGIAGTAGVKILYRSAGL